MDLGMAEERFDRDPESARELVGEAREEAKRALAELRDLARGMRPSLLAERGLGPAIVALAARSPVPATATVDVPGKLPRGGRDGRLVRGLRGARQHRQAQRRRPRRRLADAARRRSCTWRSSTTAAAAPTRSGTGLRGLAQRVAALDGSLEVHSPPGGPTVVRAVLPCE